MPTIKLGSLKCLNTEDNIGGDHAYIKVEGKTVWGPVRTMEEFDQNIGTSTKFSGKVVVELWDEDDADGDDLLGQHTLSSGSGTIEFTRDGAHYTLKYSID